MIRQGVEVRVIDHTTNEDITSLILTQIILEAGKKDGELLPLSFLVNLIQKSKERLNKWEDSLIHLEEGFLKEDGLIPEKDIPHREDVLLSVIDSFNKIIQERIETLIASQILSEEEGIRFVQLLQIDLTSNPRQSQLMEEMINTILTSLQLPTSQDIQELSEQIELLKQRISQN